MKKKKETHKRKGRQMTAEHGKSVKTQAGPDDIGAQVSMIFTGLSINRNTEC